MLQLQIFGRPTPSNSTKLSSKRNGHFYNPKQKLLDSAKWQLKSQFNQQVIRGPIELKVTYFFKVPKNTSYLKKQQMLANIIKHAVKPDRGNLDKFLEDAIKQIIIEDDARIWDFHGTKRWCASEKDEKTLIYLQADSMHYPLPESN